MVEGFELFNRGLYWRQHEVLEMVWRAETEVRLRDFYKGVIQVGVGFYHLTRRNYPGVTKVLTRGIGYLREYEPSCFGVDVARLIAEAGEVLAEVKRLGPEHLDAISVSALPRVHWRKD